MQDQPRPEIDEKLGNLIREMIQRRVAVGDIARKCQVSAYLVSVMVVEAYNCECESVQKKLAEGMAGVQARKDGTSGVRRAKACAMRAKGFSVRGIAREMHCTVKTVYKLLADRKKP